MEGNKIDMIVTIIFLFGATAFLLLKVSGNHLLEKDTWECSNQELIVGSMPHKYKCIQYRELESPR